MIINSCTFSQNNSTPEFIEDIDFSNIFVYDSQSKYKKVLRSCAGTKSVSGSCTLNTLPFLAQESSVPTKEQIMARVVVSHAWMGERFSQMLDVLPDDIKVLLGAVTAIVIDDDIIPSYYWGLTGAMYIDPRYLWLSPEEANTITQKEDYRSDFSSELIFIEAARYVLNGEYASEYVEIDSGKSRTIAGITYSLAGLLYHELAHANDYFPPALRSTVNSNLSVVETIYALESNSVTTELYNIYPLTSQALYDMGQVMYQGTSATLAQKQTTAQDMGALFMDDYAADMYAYSNSAEDTAMLFQLAMMKYHYNIEQDTAFLVAPTKTEDLVCTDYIVGWGERNSIAYESVAQRAIFVTEKILPNSQNWNSIFTNTLGNVQTMREGIDWCSSINFSTLSGQQFKVIIPNQKVNPNDFKIKPL